ncbi:Multi-sensor signal transduction histidine kinase [Citrifermentans bremense]|uniref:histidine kinase n=1 Tax=Citrifermentans bremense TaxID=60035 RepID=A0A6S6M536_9BACT|nr:ATP-binding protein [Citrifermentans bremense]BCG48780.1 Multi-sensor signal transduction histidine kinase [Citrifermentans bremense]
MHFAPFLLIAICELTLLFVERRTPVPEWLHLGVSVTVAAVFLFLAARVWKRQERVREGLQRELEEMRQEAVKSARRYKCLLEGAGNAIFIFSADTGLLREENRVGRELLGFSREELDSIQARDLLHPDEQERFRSFLYQVRRNGRGELDAVRIRKKNGSFFLAEINARLIDLGDEQVAHCLLRDITKKRRTEKEIWQRNRELSILNDILTGMNHSSDLEQEQQRTLVEIMELFDAGGGTMHLYRSDQGAARLCACSHVSAELEQRITQSLILDPERFLKVKRVKAQQMKELGAAAEGWQCVTSVPISAHDHLVGVMHLLHREPCRYSAEELRFLESVGKQMGTIIEKGRLFAELNWKSGELLRSHRLLEKSSHNLSISEIRLKQNLALVEQANLEQNRLDRMKNQFLGMVSHEFNTPLTSIISGVEHLLQNGWQGEEEARPVLELVRDGGLRLKGLVADLLKLIKVEARRGALETSAVHLRHFLDELSAQLQPQLSERGQCVTLAGLEELPYFDADRNYLERVFGELLQNAIRFSPENGEILVTGRVVDRPALLERKDTLERFNPEFLRRCGERCYLEVEVRDSGIGIPIEEQQGIFGIFYEVGEIKHHSSGMSREEGRGAGLGLAMVKGMVEAHGGMVWVESSGGSSFFLVLPLEQEAIQPALF